MKCNIFYFLWFTYVCKFIRDPLPFDNGIKILWRNGDVVDPVGQKCRIPDKNGIIAGNPTQSNVTIYAWVYTW